MLTQLQGMVKLSNSGFSAACVEEVDRASSRKGKMDMRWSRSMNNRLEFGRRGNRLKSKRMLEPVGLPLTSCRLEDVQGTLLLFISTRGQGLQTVMEEMPRAGRAAGPGPQDGLAPMPVFISSSNT